MPKVFLTPVLIAGLLLLPSCSSNDEQAKCANIQRVVAEQSAELNSLMAAAVQLDMSQLPTLAALAEKADQLRRNKFNNIVLAESCFTLPEVSEAKLWLEKNS
jgi:uncharacterized protein YcfL